MANKKLGAGSAGGPGGAADSGDVTSSVSDPATDTGTKSTGSKGKRTRQRKPIDPLVAQQIEELAKAKAKVQEAKDLVKLIAGIKTMSEWALTQVTNAVAARGQEISDNLPNVRD